MTLAFKKNKRDAAESNQNHELRLISRLFFARKKKNGKHVPPPPPSQEHGNPNETNNYFNIRASLIVQEKMWRKRVMVKFNWTRNAHEEEKK